MAATRQYRTNGRTEVVVKHVRTQIDPRLGETKAVCTSRSESKAAKPSMDRDCRCEFAIALPPDIRRLLQEKVVNGITTTYVVTFISAGDGWCDVDFATSL